MLLALEPAPPKAAVGRPGRLRPAWPMTALFVGFPLWWALGLGGLIWPVLAIPMAMALSRKERVLLPEGFGLWAAFLVWMLASGVMLDDGDRWIAFGYRASLYLSATVLLLFVFNLSERELPAARAAKVMLGFWVVVVAGGLLGVVAPDLSLTTPVEAMLPNRVLQNDFVYQLVHPATSQVHEFLGYPVPRPKAPFAYTNDWGSAFALLVPFAFLGWRWVSTPGRRLAVLVLGAVSLVPVVTSLNRGLWLSLGAALVYAAVRLALAGRGRLLQALLVLVPVVVLGVMLSPLKDLVADRFATPHSNERRLSLYQETTDDVKGSPFFGYGAPRPSEQDPDRAPVGTQGQLWLVLFSHGAVGLALFVGFLLRQLWRTGRLETETSFWVHVMLFIAVVQLAYYEMLPAQLHVIMVGVALAARERARPGAGALEPPPSHAGAMP